MGLKIIYGRSGTGKSTYIYNEIDKKTWSKLLQVFFYLKCVKISISMRI